MKITYVNLKDEYQIRCFNEVKYFAAHASLLLDCL